MPTAWRVFTGIAAFLLFFSLSSFSNQQESSQVITPQPAKVPVDNMLLVQNESSGLKGEIAFLIREVKPGSPAARAGLRPDDLILSVDEGPVFSEEQLEKTILQPTLNPGENHGVTFARYDRETGQLRIFKATITAK